MNKQQIITASLSFFLSLSLHADEITTQVHSQQHCPSLYLRDNLSYAKKGDYIVTARNKNYTILCIRERLDQGIVIEEVTIPENRFSRNIYSWKTWFEGGAPNHTAWVSYFIDLPSGKMRDYYSYTHQCWYQINEENNIFSQLLNLRFHETPHQERKRRGSSRLWQPKMVVNGNVLPNVSFTPYRARWPKDGSELAGKTIEIYLPENNEIYPSYFPYWMQISGGIGKAYIRIIDSGTELHSPKEVCNKAVAKRK